jgi:hypothetical protein
MQNIKDKIVNEIIEEIIDDKRNDLGNISEEELKETVKQKVKNKNITNKDEEINYIVKHILKKIPKSSNIKSLGVIKDIGNSTKIYAIIRAVSIFWGYQSSYFTVGIGDLIYFSGTSLFLFILGSRIEKLNDKNNKKNIKILTFYFLLLVILSPFIDKLVAFIFFIHSLYGLNRWKNLTKNKIFKESLVDVDYKFKKINWIVAIIAFIILSILGTGMDVQNGLYDNYTTNNTAKRSTIHKNNTTIDGFLKFIMPVIMQTLKEEQYLEMKKFKKIEKNAETHVILLRR